MKQLKGIANEINKYKISRNEFTAKKIFYLLFSTFDLN